MSMAYVGFIAMLYFLFCFFHVFVRQLFHMAVYGTSVCLFTFTAVVVVVVSVRYGFGEDWSEAEFDYNVFVYVMCFKTRQGHLSHRKFNLERITSLKSV